MRANPEVDFGSIKGVCCADDTRSRGSGGPNANPEAAIETNTAFTFDEQVHKTVSHFTVPPRAHPSTGSQSGRPGVAEPETVRQTVIKRSYKTLL